MFAKLVEKFNQLSQQEKIMVCLAVLVAAWAVWDTLLYEPLRQKQNALFEELVTLQQQHDAQRQALLEASNHERASPNAALQQKLSDLKAESARLQTQLMSGDKKFVPPALMAKALSDVLNQNQQLTLIELKTLPVITLLANKEQQPIYKHGLMIRFSGDYMATLHYLNLLEALPWHFVWDSIDYRVTTYPRAEIVITVYTLSFEEKWLDV
ncbi:MAG: hypothetical protein WAX77_02940 [Methylococcaceae bacterium]